MPVEYGSPDQPEKPSRHAATRREFLYLATAPPRPVGVASLACLLEQNEPLRRVIAAAAPDRLYSKVEPGQQIVVTGGPAHLHRPPDARCAHRAASTSTLDRLRAPQVRRPCSSRLAKTGSRSCEPEFACAPDRRILGCITERDQFSQRAAAAGPATRARRRSSIDVDFKRGARIGRPVTRRGPPRQVIPRSAGPARPWEIRRSRGRRRDESAEGFHLNRGKARRGTRRRTAVVAAVAKNRGIRRVACVDRDGFLAGSGPHIRRAIECLSPDPA